MQFLHMHHAMANKAIMQVKYTEGLCGSDDQTLKRRVREVVLSGDVDYRSNFERVTITSEDRELVLKYLGA